MNLMKTVLLGAALGSMTLGSSALARYQPYPVYHSVPGGYVHHGQYGSSFVARPDSNGQCPSTGRCTRIDLANPTCAYYGSRPFLQYIGYLLMPRHCNL